MIALLEILGLFVGFGVFGILFVGTIARLLSSRSATNSSEPKSDSNNNDNDKDDDDFISPTNFLYDFNRIGKNF